MSKQNESGKVIVRQAALIRELLAALKEVRLEYERAKRADGLAVVTFGLAESIRKAETAIAKAEGGAA